MDTFDMACKIIGGGGAVLVAVSMLYVCAVMVFVRDLVGPPPTLFAGIFCMLAAMLGFAGAHLIAG
jgi:hypothetical protein